MPGRVPRWWWLWAALGASAATAQPASTSVSTDAGMPDAGAAASNPAPTAPATAGTRRTGRLRVGFAGSPPFVSSEAPPDGLSIGVWRLAAAAADLRYDLVPVPSVGAALDAVSRGELDVAVGPISITSERAARVVFTQPYFQSRIGILARMESVGIWSRLRPFLTRVFAGASLVLLLSLLGVGSAIWLMERRSNPEHFPRDPLRGIGNGMWFALVTMTTVGYGDRAPVTLPGRVVTGLWMLVALVTTTSLTAGFASAFTLLQLETVSIQRASELHDRPVAVVRGTTGAAFAREQGARTLEHTEFADAVRAVDDGTAVAVLHDAPILRYYLSKHPESPLQLAAATYNPQGYGFAVAPGRDIVQRLDVALLAAREDGQVRRVVDTWLGKSRD